MTSADKELDVAYGQFYEDIFLMRVFNNVSSGFYIDIGAWHPVKYSVSYPFYLKGWRGICIEPLEHHAALADRLRPRDINVRCLVGERDGIQELHVAAGVDGLSTTVVDYAHLARQQGAELKTQTFRVRTLREICETYGVTEIDFLKVDVEGAERAVIASADWQRWRPKVLVIEATVPGTQIPAWDEWEPLLVTAGFVFAGFDGLNRYYAAQEHMELIAGLEIDRKPWSEARYLYKLGDPATDPGHPDHAVVRALSQGLIRNVARRPDLAAALLVADIIAFCGSHSTSEEALEILQDRLPLGQEAWPQPKHEETLTDYCLRLLKGPGVSAAIGRTAARFAD